MDSVRKSMLKGKSYVPYTSQRKKFYYNTYNRKKKCKLIKIKSY